MRGIVAAFLVCATSGLASAEPVQLRVAGLAEIDDGSWQAGLPAISADGSVLALPRHVFAYEVAGGSWSDASVELVPVGSLAATSTLTLYGGDGPEEEIAHRVATINEALAAGGFRSLGDGTGELGSGVYFNPVVPEELASRLRSA